MDFRPIIDIDFSHQKSPPSLFGITRIIYRVERGVKHAWSNGVGRPNGGWMLDGIFDGRMLDGIFDGIFDGRNKKRYISLAMLLAFFVCILGWNREKK